MVLNRHKTKAVNVKNQVTCPFGLKTRLTWCFLWSVNRRHISSPAYLSNYPSRQHIRQWCEAWNPQSKDRGFTQSHRTLYINQPFRVWHWCKNPQWALVRETETPFWWEVREWSDWSELTGSAVTEMTTLYNYGLQESFSKCTTGGFLRCMV